MRIVSPLEIAILLGRVFPDVGKEKECRTKRDMTKHRPAQEIDHDQGRFAAHLPHALPTDDMGAGLVRRVLFPWQKVIKGCMVRRSCRISIRVRHFLLR